MLELDAREIGVTPCRIGKFSQWGLQVFDSSAGGAGHVAELFTDGREWFERAAQILFRDEAHHRRCATACLQCVLISASQFDYENGWLQRERAYVVIQTLLSDLSAPDARLTSHASSISYLNKHLGADPKWARINRKVWSMLDTDPEHALRLSEVDVIAQETSSEPEEVLAVLALLSRRTSALLKMECLERNSTGLKEISNSEVIARLRAWWREKSLSEEQWERWASATVVRWRAARREDAR
jgi:hypothetical protein